MTDHAPMNDAAIAIIGMACRFPDAPSLEDFWRNLCAGHEAVARLADADLLAAGVDPALLGDPNYVRAGALLPEYDRFDAAFFGFTPREAELLDPQQRLMLETAWEAIESAGYTSATYTGAIGVYAGSGVNYYFLNHLYPNRDLLQSAGAYQLFLDNHNDFLATRLAYKLNLSGPSVTVQTACSTSLVAVHLACQGLLAGECDMALAGGVSLLLPQGQGYLYQEGMILSPEGHCRAFAADARGTVGGSGVGVVVLKRWADAVADGDVIHAVIRGSALNNDGSAKVSFTAPSVDGQARVIREAQAVAEVEPTTITYVEAHGTGTLLGDPIEIAALTQAFQCEGRGFCAIGSVKTNLGHADGAAGVAGLIKTALALKHGLLPPSLHAERPNPALGLDKSPFYINTTLTPWERTAGPRRAGVSSFGVGGTNAHVVLEEAPPRAPSGPGRPWQLLLLSARSEVALDSAAGRLAEHLTQHAELNLADLAYTLASGRQRHVHRRMVVCQSLADAAGALRGEAANGQALTGYAEATQRPVAFMFPGQGTQAVNMGRELYASEPVFREHVDHCAELLLPHAGFDLRELLYPAEEDLAEATQRINQTAVAQPAIFVVSYALAQLWLAWGVRPQALIGHSIGEYVAATLAGVLSLPEALELVAVRGRLMQSMPKGAMLAVALPPAQLTLPAELDLAAVNGPAMCVVSGPTQAVAALEQQLTEQGVSCRRLHTSHAFHSALMEPMLAPLAAQLSTVRLQPPQIPYLSNLTGTWITDQEATDPAYWLRHTREPVQFAAGLAELLKEPELILLEVGPGRALSTLARQQPGLGGQVVLRSLPQQHEAQPELACLLMALGQIWMAGGAISWAGFYAHERRQRLVLPTYPFERQRYWIDPPADPARATGAHAAPAGKRPPSEWFYAPGWERAALPRVALPAPQAERCWLLFLDELGLGEHLAARLRGTGHAVVTVRPGAGLTRLGDTGYRLDPRRPEQYVALIEALLARGQAPQDVVHLWRVTAATPAPTSAAMAAGMQAGFYSLVALAQALAVITSPVRLAVVSSHMHSVTGAEAIAPEKAALLGPVRVIPQEYPGISCCSIDVEAAGEPGAAALAADQVLAELALRYADAGSGQTSPEVPVVAYRGAYRWQQSFRALPLDAGQAGPSRFREGGVYLITGGLGGIGLLLAEHLAPLHTKLVLIGRTPVPPRAAWDAWLTAHGEDDALSRTLRRLQAVEQAGAEVLALSADVADEQQMRAVLKEAERAFGRLHGVIHAAGVTREHMRFIHALGPADCEPHFRAKVYGTLVLQRLLTGKELDFCLAFSSLAAVLGGMGFAAYAAANAAMDASVAAQAQGRETPWVSVSWDEWRLNAPRAAAAPGSSVAELALTPPEGLAALGAILAADGVEQVIVSTGDLHARMRQWQRPKGTPHSPEAAPSRPQGARSARRPYLAPRDEVEQQVAAIWQELLGIDAIGALDDFWELGGHSLLATQVIAHVRKVFQIALPMQTIFDEPTVGGLASYLALTQRIAAGAPGQASPEDVELEEGVL